MSWSEQERSALRVVHDYVSAGDLAPDARSDFDVIVGLGHFDRAVPRLCGEWAAAGRARWIVFTGGVGAGSGDFRQAEALEFRDELARGWPELLGRVACLETRSTNTGENFAFTTAELRATRPELRPGETLRSAVLVATPCRLRRAMATARRHWPDVHCQGLTPRRSLDEEQAQYARFGLDLRTQLTGEIERLVAYPARGFIAPVAIPAEVEAAARWLGAKIEVSRRELEGAPGDGGGE
jgi:hypothetical protein